MTNHNPTITSSAATGNFSENANTTDSGALHLLSGTMNFKDSDHSDMHTTSASLKSAVLSNGSVIPADSLADLTSAMTSTILNDSDGSGKLKWSFSAADEQFDFLAKNQKLILTYNIMVSDNHGGTTKKTVTVTITGTDDKPVIDFGANTVVSEQAGQTLSFAPDTAHVAVHFVDVDLTNTGHTATVVAATAAGSIGGLLPGFLGQLELMSFFHVDNVVKASGSSDGTINTTFSAPDLAFDYLAAGETLDITYTIRLNDNAGGVSTQTVVVTVIGTNDGPKFFCGPDTAHLTEGQDVSPAGDLTACGDFHFADIDLSDMHTVSTTVSASRSGGGAIPLSNADLLAALSTSLDDSDGHVFGEVDWSFALDNGSVSFLNSGETLTLTYSVIITDDAGATATQTVTVTILGTNDPVVITSGPESASLAEFADTTGSSLLNMTSPVPTGMIGFTDTDLGDTHTLVVSVSSAAWSGGPGVPAVTQTDLTTALITSLNDSTGTGTGGVDWTFAIPDNDLDFLAAGETLTVTYDVAVSDGPTSATQTVSITVDGANDAVLIISGPGSASLDEQPNMSGSTSLDTTSPDPTGTLSFTDVDLNDTHTTSVTLTSAIWSFDPFSVPGQTLADLQTALATTLHDSTGTGFGGVDWTFSIQDQDLDFLAFGETLTVTYDVMVVDAATSSTQTVTITISGAEDQLIVNPLTAALTDTAAPDTGQIVASGNLIADADDSGGDLSNPLTIVEVNGQPVVGSVDIAGAYGTLSVFSDGLYFYVANASLDPLQVGDNATEQFDFTVTDGFGHNVPTTLTLNVMGANDAPHITAAEALGSMTEDAGPTAVVNGSFETGDLSGWIVGSGASVEYLGIGGGLGNYSVRLNNGGLSQDVATTPGQHYTLSFFVAGDPESTSNSFSVFWDGVPVVSVVDSFGGFTRYTVDVVGDAMNVTTQLAIGASGDGSGLFLDQVAVEAATGPATETADGSISFADIETVDTHTASFAPQNVGYVGAFSLDAVTEASGSGSVGWHFTVDNSDIQFLSQGQSLTQTYTVLVTDDHGASAAQDVTVTINGANDAPAAIGQTVITDIDPDAAVFIPGWALARNGSDPDSADTLSLASVGAASGGTAFSFGGIAFFIEDAILGGSFDYDVTDGIAVSAAPATATVVNNGAGATALVGTGGNDILIASNGGETLDGGGGNDILIGNSGAHTMTGGTGDDIFAFQQTTDGLNTITDFNNATAQDLIAVSASGFGGGLTAGMDVAPLFESSGDALFLSGESRFHYDTASQTLYYSADGTDVSAVALAQVQAGVVLHANDLLIV